MAIWEDEKYQSVLQEQMEKEAREWFKNKKKENEGYNGF